MKQRYIPRLRQERERRGWSRNYVAEQTEVDMVTVGRWERGERLPHPVYRQKLCALFEMNAEDLGLFSESQKPEQEAAMAGVSSSELVLRTLDATETVTSPPEHLATEKKKLASAPPPGFSSRRALLIGLGGIGIAAVAGTGLLLTSRLSNPSTPAPTPWPKHIASNKPFQQFIDPNASNWINRLSWSPDGRYLAAATSANLISIWNRENGEFVRYYHTPNVWVNDVSWSKTNWLAVTSADYYNGSLQIWKNASTKPIATFQRTYPLRTASWSPDGSYLAFAGHAPTVEVWNPFTSHLISQYSYPALGTLGISRVKWSAAGDLLACAADDGTVHVWEAFTGQVKFIYRKHQTGVSDVVASRVIDVAWSPDSRYIVSAGADKTARVWEALSGRTICIYKGHTGRIEGVDWSLQGKYIVSGGTDQKGQVWEALTGKLIVSYEQLKSVVETTLWSNDGTMVVLGTDKQGIEIWRVPPATS